MATNDCLDDIMARTTEPLFSRENIDTILAVIPPEARCCYTGQSILAYCPEPTFDWAELNAWPDETDVDIFVYTKVGLSALVQAFIDAGFEPADEINEFKSERARFFEQPRKFNLTTVGLKREGLPIVNLTWYNDSDDLVTVVRRFDMDYLMVGMDVRTGTFFDMRGKNPRVAHVNHLNQKFDVDDVDAMFWIRQFDRCPKGWSRGIDTRPVARQYLQWIDEAIERGDWAAGSKTRKYADEAMAEKIENLVSTGITQEQAEALYHMVRGEEWTWEAMRLNYERMRTTISTWLTSVEND
jgi:hypothetical protein